MQLALFATLFENGLCARLNYSLMPSTHERLMQRHVALYLGYQVAVSCSPLQEVANWGPEIWTVTFVMPRLEQETVPFPAREMSCAKT
ncbi:hypothetical protein F4782DRAFT_508658 [Xylaria castorea]|nr:hypothetical protein F4782DRAFT_508658 [Xylaria castorea]